MRVNQTKTQFIEEGQYAAEVEVEIINNDFPWSPIVAKEDVFKTDRVRLALRRGDVASAAREAKVFEISPLAGGKIIAEKTNAFRIGCRCKL